MCCDYDTSYINSGAIKIFLYLGERPNAFVSVRVSSQHIRSKLQELQDAMVKIEPSVQSCLVSLNKLHVTMMVLKLSNKTEIQRYIHD